MDWVLTILYVVIMLMVLVVIHEFGHFIVGLKSGIKINEFSVGFGPKIFSRVKKGIRYSLRCLPIGGFVQFHGEDEDMPDDPLAFNNAPIGRRFLTVLAGPVMNFVLAIFIAIIALSCFGDYYVSVDSVVEGSPAQQVGIMENDKIIGINDASIDFYSDYYIHKDDIGNSEKVKITVLRDGEKLSFDVPTVKNDEGRRMIGVNLYTERKSFNIFEAFCLSFKWVFVFTWQIIVTLFETIKKADISQLSGVVGMTTTVRQTVESSGLEGMLRLASLLSLNLGIFNLLPFPALDGGRLVFIAIEKIRRKPVSRKVEGYVNFIGLLLLFALMIIITVQDVSRLAG